MEDQKHEEEVGKVAKKLQMMAKENSNCADKSHGTTLSCKCVRQLLDEPTARAVAEFKVGFSRLPKYQQQEVVRKEVRLAAEVQVKPGEQKHVTHRLPMAYSVGGRTWDEQCPRICKPTFMSIIEKGKGWMQTALKGEGDALAAGVAPDITDQAWPKWASNMAKQKEKDKARKNRLAVQESTKKKKYKDQREALLDIGGRPAMQRHRGTREKRDECASWLKKQRDTALEDKKEQSNKSGRPKRKRDKMGHFTGPDYDPVKDIPMHQYSTGLYCDKNHLPENCTVLAKLANEDFGSTIDEYNDYDDFLRKRSAEARDLIRDQAEFQGLAIASMMDETKKSALISSVMKDESIRSIGSIKPEEGLEDPFSHTMRVAELHDQRMDDTGMPSQYVPHNDKIGNLVAFLGMDGSSYNFFALPSTSPTKKEAFFKSGVGDYVDYQKYKTGRGISKDEAKRIERFEKKFLDMATKLKLLEVRVYKLCAADMIVFPAKDFLHGTIIPKTDTGNRRALLVFHDMVKKS